MRALELLIEDYERRLKTMTATISEQKDKETINRWRTKMSCYHTFISELKRVWADDVSTESKLNLSDVNGSIHHYVVQDKQTLLILARFANRKDAEKYAKDRYTLDSITIAKHWD